MGNIKQIDGRYQAVIPLSVRPAIHETTPTITASAISNHAGTALFGYFRSEWALPGGDRLLMFANHDRANAQLILLTHDAKKLRFLPGTRHASLVANTIAQLHRYRIVSDYYPKPRTPAQDSKYQMVCTAIDNLEPLLEQERKLTPENWQGQEELRQAVHLILKACQNENRLLLANNPVISEGNLGDILFNLLDSNHSIHHFQFNRLYPVCRLDQLDFTKEKLVDKEGRQPCFVWDSDEHIGNDEKAMLDTLRMICQEYKLDPGEKLANIQANRLHRLGAFFRNLWADSREFIAYLATPFKPTQPSETVSLTDGLSITKTKPYYIYDPEKPIQVGYNEEEYNKLEAEFKAKCFKEGNRYYIPPSGDDLVTISQLSAQHLYLHERLSLQLKVFIARLPTFFVYLYHSITHFIVQDLYKDFSNYIHHRHAQQPQGEANKKPSAKAMLEPYLVSILDILDNQGLLATGETLEEFIKRRILQNNYVIAQEKHPPSPPRYENPLHRILDVFRHIASFFVNSSEKNPIIGTLAMAAYAYGAGAVIAPQVLTDLLTKLHLHGLIKGIEPTQAFGKWMSHGTSAEAVSAAAMYWQGITVAGQFDLFFTQAVELLKDEPAQVAIVTALAMSIGFGLCKAVPSLNEETGEFPYFTYLGLGIKGGTAANDTIMYPGDDWLLGTVKWLLKLGLIPIKFFLGPLVASYHYGRKGFFTGLRQSGYLLINSIKQTFTALFDLFLDILTIPLIELSTLFLHVPFRGLTNLMSNTLGLLGNLGALGEAISDLASHSITKNYLAGFRLSPLYGFDSPFARYVQNDLINLLYNGLMLFTYPPMQLIKNIAILPTIDLSSFTIRMLLCALHPLVTILIHTVGSILTISGFFWDKTFGQIFQIAAKTVILAANWIDHIAGHFKHSMLSDIQALRCAIFHWSFKDEDRQLHKVNNDLDYLMKHTRLVEQLPHQHNDSTHCLLQALIGDKLNILKKLRKKNNYSNVSPVASAPNTDLSADTPVPTPTDSAPTPDIASVTCQ